ncbi:hypothetical protein L1987_38837 [Smallanthus sonchifolius]|uniref:Uncharacterized protein n=1 Tax=Smallanthus sonchifolius TaxID=185202 RepID=A0ACB9HKL3_9ASTR|nr:hypothetical protein L1987_38837 [Smallanthus sonchifolius]
MQQVVQIWVFNFATGPTTLPENVLRKAESELYNWRGAGTSVTEMSHRGKEFLSIIQKVESDMKKLLDISDDYAVMFLQGGAPPNSPASLSTSANHKIASIALSPDRGGIRRSRKQLNTANLKSSGPVNQTSTTGSRTLTPWIRIQTT